MKKYFLIVCVCFYLVELCAAIKMSAIFSDNMLIQQNQLVEIWGSADVNSIVKVTAKNVQSSTKADSNGKWRLHLPAMKGSFEPFTIQIFENSKLAKEIKNVLCGEVWIAGGQSNMAMELSGIKGSKEFVAKMQESKIRYFLHPTPISKMKSMKSGLGSRPCDDFIEGAKWIDVDKKNVWSTSAVAFIFAYNLMEKINVPVGIVFNAVAGSKMECWVSQQAYESSPNFKTIRDKFNECLEKYDYKKNLKKINAKVKKYNADKKSGKKNIPPSWTVADFMRPWIDSPYMWKSPYMFYNIRIHPMRNYTAKGVVWYQGESNEVEGFESAFECLISEWRKYFNNPNLPFICVQLPSYKADKWAEKRQAQKRVADKVQNTYIIPTIDTGEKNDIHPHDKMEIGVRLANEASIFVYKSRPSVKYPCEICKIEFIQNGVKISLTSKPQIKGKLRGFEVLSNGKWIIVDENIKIKISKSPCDNTSWIVYLNFQTIKNLEGIRYLWKSWAKPDVCLYGMNNLPVFPFKFLKKD